MEWNDRQHHITWHDMTWHDITWHHLLSFNGSLFHYLLSPSFWIRWTNNSSSTITTLATLWCWCWHWEWWCPTRECIYISICISMWRRNDECRHRWWGWHHQGCSGDTQQSGQPCIRSNYLHFLNDKIWCRCVTDVDIKLMLILNIVSLRGVKVDSWFGIFCVCSCVLVSLILTRELDAAACCMVLVDPVPGRWLSHSLSLIDHLSTTFVLARTNEWITFFLARLLACLLARLRLLLWRGT